VPVTVDDADDADHGRIHLVVDRVRESTQQHTPQAPAYHREALGCLGNMTERRVDLGQEVGRCVLGSGEIPLEGLRDLSAGSSPDAEPGHLANPRAELVAESGPWNAGVRIGVGLRLTTVEFGGESRRDRSGGDRI
jgi:hypothetical protein